MALRVNVKARFTLIGKIKAIAVACLYSIAASLKLISEEYAKHRAIMYIKSKIIIKASKTKKLKEEVLR